MTVSIFYTIYLYIFSKQKLFQLKKQENFELSLIADGMLAGKEIRTLQAHYGISLCGEVFQTHSVVESERKYQKALNKIKIIRLHSMILNKILSY